jgi:ligand-binding sensor protein
MKITDLLPKEEWKQLENEFFLKTGLDTSIYDPDGFTFTGLKQWANNICPRIKARPESLQAVCAVAHQNLAHQAKQTGKYVIEECDIGLIKICVPIIVENECIGAFSGCGLLMEEGEVETFLVHKLTNMDEAEIEELVSQIKTISEIRVREVAVEMEDRIKEIVSDFISKQYFNFFRANESGRTII